MASPLAPVITRNGSSGAPGRRVSRGSHSLPSPVHHKSNPYFPSAKVRWLRCLPIPEPVFFAAYLKLGNPQELQAREAVCQEPPALMGIFYEGLFI